MGALQVTLLGGFQARLPDGRPVVFARKKAQALLAYLALQPDRAHPREKLAALLWGDVPGERARHSLRQALLALRRALSGAAARCVAEEGDGVSVDSSLIDVDVVGFERLARRTPKATPEDDRPPHALRVPALIDRGEESVPPARSKAFSQAY